MTTADDAGTASPSARATHLLTRCTEVVGVDGAGLSLARGDLTEPILGTDPVAEALEQVQFTIGEGPCVDATRLGVPVFVVDLDDVGGGHAGRWPVFVRQARTLGVRAVFSLPLRVGPSCIGAVNLWRATPGPLTGAALGHALGVMDDVTLTFLDETVVEHGSESPGPHTLSLEVHRAAGMLMVQLGITIEQALVRLRATAFTEGVPVERLARDVIEGTRRFEEEQ